MPVDKVASVEPSLISKISTFAQLRVASGVLGAEIRYCQHDLYEDALSRVHSWEQVRPNGCLET